MKLGIHPEDHPVVFQDASTGEQFLTGSTANGNKSVAWTGGRSYSLIPVDITSGSHPFWTGTQRIVDTAGQVEKFHRLRQARSLGS